MRKLRNPRKAPKRTLALPDLEHTKSAVVNRLSSASGQRTYAHAIDEFVGLVCFGATARVQSNRRAAVPHLPRTARLCAGDHQPPPRRGASHCVQGLTRGSLSPELAAGIRRVKGVRRLGVRVGNWLTADQGRRLLDTPTLDSLREQRNRAMLAMLIGCGLRRGELLALTMEAIQQREERWVIADVNGKAGHIRTVPVPS